MDSCEFISQAPCFSQRPRLEFHTGLKNLELALCNAFNCFLLLIVLVPSSGSLLQLTAVELEIRHYGGCSYTLSGDDIVDILASQVSSYIRFTDG